MLRKQVHVTDVNERGTFAVNTFERALRRVTRPLGDLPHVVYLRRGRPTIGIVTGKEVGRDGRTRVEVIEPARGPRGPYVRNVVVEPEIVYPNPSPLPEEARFVSALGQYRRNPNDYYWEAANEALADWLRAAEASPPPRGRLERGHLNVP